MVVHNKMSRLFVTDKSTLISFLVDTGADLSILPPNNIERKNISEYKLYAANGTEIKTYGQKILNLNLGLRRDFKWSFLLADVTKPIIGADFLRHFDLTVDLKRKKLIDNVTSLQINCIVDKIVYNRTSVISQHSPIANILKKFKDLVLPFNKISKKTIYYTLH